MLLNLCLCVTPEDVGSQAGMGLLPHLAPDFNELLREQHFLLDVLCEE